MAERFTRKQIEAHNSKEDAYIIIDNIVYDVSPFLEDHPGGSEILIQNSGQDASQCFHDVGHSDDAIEWRKRFKVGEIVDEDRWEVIKKKEIPWGGSDEPLSLLSIMNVWGPPLALGLLATIFYTYLFG